MTPVSSLTLTHTHPPHPPDVRERTPGLDVRGCEGEQSWLIHLRTEGAGPPPIIRLRQWLKIGLRSFGLRAVKISSGDKLVDTESPVETVTGDDSGGCEAVAMDIISVGDVEGVK